MLPPALLASTALARDGHPWLNKIEW